MICNVDNCTDPAKVRGLCVRHYTRLLNHGSPTGGGKDRYRGPTLTPEESRARRAAAARARRAANPGVRWVPPDGLCTKCRAEPATDWNSWGLRCFAEYQRERRKDPIAKVKIAGWKRTAHLRSVYGLTDAEFAARLKAQGNACAICRRPYLPPSLPLSVDHDHACCPGRRSCGKCIRGLLCHWCNGAIGWFETVGLEPIEEYLHVRPPG
jgi:hypothetical protein